MSPLFENAVIISIVIAILFFGYHVAMYLIHKEAKTMATKMHSKQVSPTLIETIPSKSNHDITHSEQTPSVGNTPMPSDPHHKSEGSSTFTTNMRLPENSFSKYETVPGGEGAPQIDAQNEGAFMGDVNAWNGDSAQPFSSVDAV